MKQELDTLAQHVIRELRTRHILLCVAESCTGGLIADRLTQVPGSSDVFWGGFVTYQYEAKSSLLGVPAEHLRTQGAVSAEVAAAMAQGALKHLLTSLPGRDAICLSTTGIAGPTGGTPEKPVGLCYIGFATGLTSQEVITHRVQSPASFDRDRNKIHFAEAALGLLLSSLSSDGND